MVRRVALLLLLLAASLGCGADGAAPQVVVETFAVDGPAPPGLVLVPTAAGATPVALVARGGARYDAPGAPEGPFVVEGPQGWSTLSLGGATAALVRGAPPPVVHLGRPRTIYLAPLAEDLRPGRTWVVRARGTGGEAPRRVDAEVLVEPGSRLAALRLPAQAWEGEVEVLGRLARGTLAIDVGEEGPLAQPVRVALRAGGRPFVLQVRAAAEEALVVVLVPATPEVPVDGLTARLEVPALAPLEVVLGARSRQGVLRWPGVPLLDADLRVTIEGQGTIGITPAERRTLASVHVLALPQGGRRAVGLALPGGVVPDRIVARPQGAPAFGRLPWALAAGGVTVELPQADTLLWLGAGGRFARVAVSEDDPEAPVFVPGVTIQGRVEGLLPGTPAVLGLALRDGGVGSGGDGLDLRVDADGSVAGVLPPGTYELEVVTSRGVWRRPQPLDATTPGGHHQLVLRAP